MPENNELQLSILEPLKSFNQSELRQLPKLVAKTFISLQQVTDVIFDRDPFEGEQILANFGARVAQLPTGLVLELWKTFLYHLEADVLPDLALPKAKNMICLTDPLMSTFLKHACVVEQSLPQRQVDKIVEFSTKTQSLAASLPRVQLSLFEVSLLLKNCHQVDLSDVNGALEKSGSKLVKRKYESLLEEKKPSKKVKTTKLTYKDVLPENLKYLPAVVDELSDGDILDAAKLLLKKDNLMNQCSKVVAEDSRLQMGLLIKVAEKIHLHLGTNDSSNRFFSSILSDPESWLRSGDTNNGDKVSEAAESLKQLIVVKPEKFSVFSINHPIKLLEMLPLECARGELEILTSLFVVWTLISRKSDLPTNGLLVKAFARCLDVTFRNPAILKFIDFSLLAPKLSRVEVEAGDEPHVEQMLKSLSKIATTYQKTLEATLNGVELFCGPLEDFSDAGEVRLSVVILESIAGTLTRKDVADEKKSICRKISDRLCLSFEKGLKLLTEETNSEVKFLAVRALNAAIDIAESTNEPMKKWLKMTPKLVPFCFKVRNRCQQR